MLAEAEHSEAAGSQSVERNSAQTGNIDTNQKGGFDVSPHRYYAVSLLPGPMVFAGAAVLLEPVV